MPPAVFSASTPEPAAELAVQPAPVPPLLVRAAGTPLPASLQLVGPPQGEELLLATARRIEAAAT